MSEQVSDRTDSGVVYRPEVDRRPVRSPLDDTVRAWICLHRDRVGHTGFAIAVADVTSFLTADEARAIARELERAADDLEALRAAV